MAAKTIAVQNVNHPGSVREVDAQRYALVRGAYLELLPDAAPGLTLAEITEQLTARVPAALFAEGAGIGWWAKTVQLDLEAKGLIAREPTRPLRIHKVRARSRVARRRAG